MLSQSRILCVTVNSKGEFLLKYIYTKNMCSACIALKKKYDDEGVEYVERDGNRLSTFESQTDQIDIDAFVVLNMQNMTFPVEVEG